MESHIIDITKLEFRYIDTIYNSDISKGQQMRYRENQQNARRHKGAGDRGDGFGGRMRMRHGRKQGHGPRGRRRRPLNHGDLRVLILDLLTSEPRHGYDLIREIESRTGGAYVPSPGVIYPALEALLDLGLVKVELDGQRRMFQLTKAGQTEHEANTETLQAIAERLAALQESERPEDPEDVRGAMHRLRHTVRDTVRSDPDNAANRKAIADILADAQQRIHRLRAD